MTHGMDSKRGQPTQDLVDNRQKREEQAMNEPQERLIDDYLAGQTDRRTFLLRAATLGLSTSALAGLVARAAAAATSSPAVADVVGGERANPLVPKVKLVKKPGDKKVKIAFDLPSQAQLRWRFDQKYFQAAVEQLGDEVVFQNANDDAQQQANQVENFISQKPDVIIVAPVDVEAAGALATQAARAGIPVLAYNNNILKSKGVAWWVARDNRLVGHITADLAIKARPRGNYIIASGDQGTDIARDKTAGYMDRLNPHIKAGRIKLVSQQYNRQWDPARGQAQIENMNTKYKGDIAAVLCNYDGFCLSALQVFKGNADGKVWIGGEDVFPEFANSIAKGAGAMSAYTDLQGMARYAAQAAHDLANGRKPTYQNANFNNGATVVRGQRVSSFAVTASNMCQFITETGWLNYNATYKGVPASKRPKC
jgi:D-xylose transport system substrate-binding protein